MSFSHGGAPGARHLALQAFEHDHRLAYTAQYWLNPFHKRSLETLEASSVRVAEGLLDASVAQVRRVRTRQSMASVALRDCVDWVEHCSDPNWVAGVVAAEIEQRHTLATDPNIIHSPVKGFDTVTVQHRATGMRIRMHPSDTGIGVIEARSYRIASLEPGDTDNGLGWERWAGLGTGTRLYEFGAALFPDQRWGTSATKSSAFGVRAKCHAVNAYRWQATCDWCRSNNVTGALATQDSFATHPKFSS